MKDDEEARKQRAKRLRDLIGTIADGEQNTESLPPDSMKPGESPHEFTQRRMREIAEAERKKGTEP